MNQCECWNKILLQHTWKMYGIILCLQSEKTASSTIMSPGKTIQFSSCELTKLPTGEWFCHPNRNKLSLSGEYEDWNIKGMRHSHGCTMYDHTRTGLCRVWAHLCKDKVALERLQHIFIRMTSILQWWDYKIINKVFFHWNMKVNGWYDWIS